MLINFFLFPRKKGKKKKKAINLLINPLSHTQFNFKKIVHDWTCSNKNTTFTSFYPVIGMFQLCCFRLSEISTHRKTNDMITNPTPKGTPDRSKTWFFRCLAIRESSMSSHETNVIETFWVIFSITTPVWMSIQITAPSRFKHSSIQAFKELESSLII